MSPASLILNKQERFTVDVPPGADGHWLEIDWLEIVFDGRQAEAAICSFRLLAIWKDREALRADRTAEARRGRKVPNAAMRDAAALRYCGGAQSVQAA